jgi:hypothetical protein
MFKYFPGIYMYNISYNIAIACWYRNNFGFTIIYIISYIK